MLTNINVPENVMNMILRQIGTRILRHKTNLFIHEKMCDLKNTSIIIMKMLEITTKYLSEFINRMDTFSLSHKVLKQFW